MARQFARFVNYIWFWFSEEAIFVNLIGAMHVNWLFFKQYPNPYRRYKKISKNPSNRMQIKLGVIVTM